jgi:excisionase family DNA binding protein
MLEPAMTVRQVADYLNVAPKVVYRLVQQGDLPGFKVAGTWRFKRADIDGWIEDQKRRVMLSDAARVEDTPSHHAGSLEPDEQSA